MSGAERMEIPKDGGPVDRCEKCVHWWAASAKKVVPLPNGQTADAAQLIAAGGLKPGMVVLLVAPCTLMPAWSNATHDHWCGSYKARNSLLPPNPT